MSAVQNVILERGLLRIVARRQSAQSSAADAAELSYDVEIDGQEVLHTFPSLDEASQFLDMLSPPQDHKKPPR